MKRIYSHYNPPEFLDVESVGDSITVQGLVTSLSVILNGGDDNNMKSLDLGYSETVRDLYPEMFGRPTKYELEYLQNEYPSEPGGPSDMSETSSPSEPPSASDGSGTPENAAEK